MSEHTFTPGPDLHLKVRAAFVLKGTSLKQWCQSNGTYTSNARNALYGSWNGPAGRAMRERLVRESGLADLAGQLA